IHCKGIASWNATIIWLHAFPEVLYIHGKGNAGGLHAPVLRRLQALRKTGRADLGTRPYSAPDHVIFEHSVYKQENGCGKKQETALWRNYRTASRL
ncbi:MAG: hypothetical protein LUE27_11250, partial [Clostridia bacterium]|nr:hypothetical protein [Clostridia bacterium]